jgi:hypothetical protein
VDRVTVTPSSGSSTDAGSLLDALDERADLIGRQSIVALDLDNATYR